MDSFADEDVSTPLLPNTEEIVDNTIEGNIQEINDSINLGKNFMNTVTRNFE